MRLPTYMMVASSELDSPCVIRTTYPRLIGRVLTFHGLKEKDKIEDMMSRIANERVDAVKVDGYYIFILASGFMGRAEISREETRTILREMGEYFTKERIEKHSGYYRVNRED